MSLVASYVPIAYTNVSGTVNITNTTSPGNTIIQASIPALPLYAVDVEITDLDVNNGTPYAGSLYLQIFIIGFGFKNPVYAKIGHTPAQGQLNVGANTGFLIGNVRWYLPQGGAGADLTQGGVIGLAAYVSTGLATPMQVGVSYMVVYGLFGGVV